MSLTVNRIVRDELRGRKREGEKTLFNKMYFWHFYKTERKARADGQVYEDERSVGECQLQVILSKPRLQFAWFLSVGNSSSETPFDGHVKFFGSAIYWGFSWGRKLAQKLTSRPQWPHGMWSRRELGFRIWDGSTLYVDIWSPEDFPHTIKKNWFQRHFWHKSYSVNPVEWFLGHKSYRYEDVESFDTTLDFKDGSYPVTITMQQQTLVRSKRPNHVLDQRWVLDIDAPKGVPTHVDHSGGWKGDRTYGWGVDFEYFERYPNTENWEKHARDAVMASVFEMRSKGRFLEPDPVED